MSGTDIRESAAGDLEDEAAPALTKTVAEAVVSRRTMLGAIVAGAVATACEAGNADSLQLSTPSSTTPSGIISNIAIIDDPEPVSTAAGATPDVALPVPETMEPTIPSAAAEASTSTTAATASPPTVAVPPTVAEATTTTAVTVAPPTVAVPPTVAESTSTTVAQSTSMTVAAPTSTTVAQSTSTSVAVPTTAVSQSTSTTVAAPTSTTVAEPTTTTVADGTTTSTTAPGPVTPVTTAAAVDVAVARLTYGYKPGMRAAAAEMGAAGFIADQLAKAGPDPATERALAAMAGFGDEEFTYRAERNQPHVARLTQSTVFRAVNSDHQLFEMMSEFWSNHFSIDGRDSDQARERARHYQEHVIRPHAMGKFRDLVQAVVRSPGMLEYLDAATNDANAPDGVNENLGREILELHTVGIDENDQQIYDLDDVKQAALALAGMTFGFNNRTPGYYAFSFDAAKAYSGDVSLFDGQWTSVGLSGEARVTSMVDFLANHPQTARYVSYKLCQRFVADAPAISLVESAAAVFQASDTDIVPTLQHIFESAEFAQSAGLKYRRPFEFATAALRALGVTAEANTDSSAVRDFLLTLKHTPWQWPTPDGYPDRANAWLNAAGTQVRWNFAGELARGATDIDVDLSTIRPTASTVDDLIDQLTQSYGMGVLSDADKAAMATAASTSTTANATSVNNAGFAMLVGLVLSHPLFQIR